MNRVQILGNLTKDPEIKYTKNNTAFVKVGVATNRSYKDQSTDEWKEVPTFLDVTFWGKLAEKVNQLKKGERIFVEGRLDNNNWVDKNGQKRYDLAVTGTDFFSSASTKVAKDETTSEVPNEEDVSVPPDVPEGKDEVGQDIPF